MLSWDKMVIAGAAVYVKVHELNAGSSGPSVRM
jgi:hypothetical protein